MFLKFNLNVFSPFYLRSNSVLGPLHHFFINLQSVRCTDGRAVRAVPCFSYHSIFFVFMGKQLGIIQFTGKLGNTVGARKGGVQKSNTIRAHAGEVANPNTRAQMYQRAIMATVLQAYKQGIEIFDHAFEGAKGRAGNYAEFMKKNLPMLRAIVANDIATHPSEPAQQSAQLITRGLRYTVPNPWIISDGSLVQNLFGTPRNDAADYIYYPLNEGDLNVGITTLVKDWYNSVGLVEGEIYTFVVLSAFNPDGIGFQVNNVPKAVSFTWVRLIVKPLSSIAESLTFATATFADVFDITYSGAESEILFRGSDKMFKNDEEYAEDPRLGLSVSSLFVQEASQASFGCIRSNLASGKRSPSQMYVFGGEGLNSVFTFGLKPYYVPMEWRSAGSAIPGASDKILEGGDGE